MLRVACVALLAIVAVVLVSTWPADARPQLQRFHRSAAHLEDAPGTIEARGTRRNKRLMKAQEGQVNAYAKRELSKSRTYTTNSLITNVIYVFHN